MDTNEKMLIKEIKAKNPTAVEMMMDNYGSDIYWLVYRILIGSGTQEDIEECVSDVYLEAWQSIHKFDQGKANFRTWLLIIAKYKALDYRRRAARKNVPAESDAIETLLDENKPVEDQVIADEVQKQVLEAINDLPEVDRQIFLKRYFLYESIDDIARFYGLTRAAIDNRLWRARSYLRERLQVLGKEEVL